MNEVAELIRHVRAEAHLEKQSATPLYLRVMRGIEQAIRTGLVDVNDALPAERELAAALGVSRVTVRNAVRSLVEKGLLVQRRGAGTFVASRGERMPRQLTSFTQDMQVRGFETTTVWLNRSVGLPTPEECEALEILPDTKVSRLYRLRMADGTPMCVEHAVLPQCILPEPKQITDSLYSWLDAHGRRPTRARQVLSSRLLDISHAHLLGLQTGSPCLLVERRSFLTMDRFKVTCGALLQQEADLEEIPSLFKLANEGDRPIEFVRSYFRGDLYEYEAELNI